jgi:outer membrane receptor protein involved in Fe transport
LAIAAHVLGPSEADAASAAPGTATPPAAVPTGRIEGRVVDLSGRPLEYAHVTVPAHGLGTIADEQGRYVLARVPVGSIEVQAQAYEAARIRRTVEVVSGATVRLDLVIAQRVIGLPVIEVSRRRAIDVHRSEQIHELSGEQVREQLVDDVVKAVALQAGVVSRGEMMSVRGGRPDEFQVRIDGLPASNPQTSGNAGVATLAVEGTTLRTGAFDAEHGGALSGILDIATREGTDSLQGQVRWDTYRFGDPTKTFDRFDRLMLGFGGPTPLRRLTYRFTYEGTFQDTYLSLGRTQSTRTFLDFVRLGDRQSNRIQTNLKLAYQPTARHKITLEAIDNRSRRTPYQHMWSRQGWVRVTYDTLRAPGEPLRVTPRYGGWSAVQRDARDQYVNLADHVPTIDDGFRQVNAVWTQQVDSVTAWTTRVSARAFRLRDDVQGRNPWEYWVQSPFYWSGNQEPGTETNPYFATHGDFPRWVRQRSSSVTLKSDWMTRRFRQHRFKAGFEASYNRMHNLSLTFPNVESNGLPGGARSDFEAFHPEGSAYVQDRWEFEGLVLNAGLRFDTFSPGDQIGDHELASGRRWKRQFSPRLGVAYPISDRNALSLFYGWTYQTPARGFLFENRGLGTTVNIRGNPDLEPETDVQYQAALQHAFSRDVHGQFAVFFRDIYGLITARQVRDEFGNLAQRFTNGDYASARGFEASLTKSFSHKFSADVHYTYSLATGVASDPEQALQFFNGGQLFLPISERPLEWDQRHTLTLSGRLREPGRWGLKMLWTYGSGLPFTPTFRNARRTDPRLDNARRLPSAMNLSLDADKFYRVWGQDVTLFVDARNLLDCVNIVDPAPNTAGAFNPFINLTNNADDYLIYYTETGRAGGAYLQDVDGDGVPDWVPVNDPRVFEEGRAVRMGVSVAF